MLTTCDLHLLQVSACKWTWPWLEAHSDLVGLMQNNRLNRDWECA
jgi:hypothetical protein